MRYLSNGLNLVTQPIAIILAAGKGTRMKSDLPKVLHSVHGLTLVEHVMNAARSAGVGRMVLVIGHRADDARATLGHHADVDFVLQTEQLGTGHAVQMCEQHLAAHDGQVLVLAGDTPLLQGASLARLLEEQRTENAACVVGTAVTDANEGLGRIVRDAAGEFVRIVEQKDASPEIAAIREINTGCYVFNSRDLASALKELRADNEQAEYYLTDCAAILRRQGKRVVASPSLDIEEAMGVNTPDQLADVERILSSAA